MARDTFSVPILHIYSSVGYCVVYFCLGFVRAFYQINEIDSTLEPNNILYLSDYQIIQLRFPAICYHKVPVVYQSSIFPIVKITTLIEGILSNSIQQTVLL